MLIILSTRQMSHVLNTITFFLKSCLQCIKVGNFIIILFDKLLLNYKSFYQIIMTTLVYHR